MTIIFLKILIVNNNLKSIHNKILPHILQHHLQTKMTLIKMIFLMILEILHISDNNKLKLTNKTNLNLVQKTMTNKSSHNHKHIIHLLIIMTSNQNGINLIITLLKTQINGHNNNNSKININKININ